MNLFNRVRKLRPDVNVDDYVIQDDGSGPYIAVWKSSENKPTDDEINGQDDTPSTADYFQNRQVSYPSIGDQLDDLYKKGAFSDEMAAQIQSVKDKFPKGG